MDKQEKSRSPLASFKLLSEYLGKLFELTTERTMSSLTDLCHTPRARRALKLTLLIEITVIVS